MTGDEVVVTAMWTPTNAPIVEYVQPALAVSNVALSQVMQYIASTPVVEYIAPASAVSNVVPALACGVVRSACGVACSAFNVVRSSCLAVGALCC